MIGRAAATMLFATAMAAQAPERAPAFVEVELSAQEVWQREPVVVLVRIGLDAEWFAAHAVPMFRAAVDRPVQLAVPWLRAAEDRAVAALPPPAGAAPLRIVVGDQVAAVAAVGQRTVDGRTFDLLELRFRWLPLAPGTAQVAPVELRYAAASAFADDFLRGRQPLDRTEHAVTSPPLELRVHALPVAGRPPTFTGAVGEFEVHAATGARRVRTGEPFTIDFTIRGDGDLTRAAVPPPPELPGFHVLGVRERPADTGRAFAVEVAALTANVTEVPPIRFAAFSPRAAAYVELATAPVPIAVEPLAAGERLPAGLAELAAAEQARRAARPRWHFAVLVAVALAALAGSTMLLRRRRARARLGHALAALERAAASPTGACAEFEALCAAREASTAFAGDDAWARLAVRAVDAGVVAEARRLHAALDAVRFGGALPDADAVVAVGRAIARR